MFDLCAIWILEKIWIVFFFNVLYIKFFFNYLDNQHWIDFYCMLSVPVFLKIRKKKWIQRWNNSSFIFDMSIFVEIPPVVRVSAKQDLWIEQKPRWSAEKRPRMEPEIRFCAELKWRGQIRIPWSMS